MKKPYQAITLSPIGKIGICHNQKAITQIDFLPNNTPLLEPKENFSKEIIEALLQYFEKPDNIFSFPLDYPGTAFQVKVWQALQKIPVGNTVTYGALAKELKTSARAIGNACRHNPIPIFIPCHRIVGAHSVGGFTGETQGSAITIKTWLLEHEKKCRHP